MVDGLWGHAAMKRTWSRKLSRPGFWVPYAFQLIATAQLWVATQVALDPQTSFRDHLWPWSVIFAFGVTFLAPLLGRLIVKDDLAVEDDTRLSDKQTAALELALRTGVLPVASLFADWGPALNKRRRDLKSGRWLIPILMVGIIGLNIYDSFVDPDGAWFYWISALFYAVIAVKGEATTRQRLRQVQALEYQLDARRGGLPSHG